jgi:glycosyltransferase involved in cell wall biosynthesis
MTQTPRASIIINNYNYGRFLAEAIDSALAQTYANTEVIVVDDGSTDNSREIIKQYGGRCTAIEQENGGQGAAYNAGFAASRGDFVCFLDADDALHPSAMSQVATAFDDLRLVKVEWQMDVIDEHGRKNGSIVPEKPLPTADLREQTISNGPFYDWWITTPGSGACYRRTMLERVLPMPAEKNRHGADVYLTVLAPIFGNVERLTGAFGCYRQHENNNYFGRALTNNRLKDYLGRFDNYCSAVREQLSRQGVKVNVDEWKRRNFNYLWPNRLLKAKDEIAHLIPEGAGYILIDNNELAGGTLTPGRRAMPFVERDGAWWGPPSDEYAAVAELERLTSTGIQFVVFWWTAFWWLTEYFTLDKYLREHATRLIENDALKIFQFENSKLESRCASRS